MPEQAIILTMARHIAKREVKEEWKRQRIKLSHLEAWEFYTSCRYLSRCSPGRADGKGNRDCSQ